MAKRKKITYGRKLLADTLNYARKRVSSALRVARQPSAAGCAAAYSDLNHAKATIMRSSGAGHSTAARALGRVQRARIKLGKACQRFM